MQCLHVVCSVVNTDEYTKTCPFSNNSLHLFCYTLLHSFFFFLLSSSPFLLSPLLFFVHTRPSGPHGFQERLAATQEAMKNKNVVNLGAIRQGMKRFQFLLNCCEPGTIPDASILAAALDLVCFNDYSLDFVFSNIYISIFFYVLVLPGSSGGGSGLALPRMCPIRPPL